MVVPEEVKQKEKEIAEDLKILGIQVSFKINDVDLKEKAWLHTIGFYNVLPKERNDKLWEIIRKHYDEWYQHLPKE